jgi:hypothetical protein
MLAPSQLGILLVGGDKRGQKRFYEPIIPLAESISESYLIGE